MLRLLEREPMAESAQYMGSFCTEGVASAAASAPGTAGNLVATSNSRYTPRRNCAQNRYASSSPNGYRGLPKTQKSALVAVCTSSANRRVTRRTNLRPTSPHHSNNHSCAAPSHATVPFPILAARARVPWPRTVSPCRWPRPSRPRGPRPPRQARPAVGASGRRPRIRSAQACNTEATCTRIPLGPHGAQNSFGHSEFWAAETERLTSRSGIYLGDQWAESCDNPADTSGNRIRRSGPAVNLTGSLHQAWQLSSDSYEFRRDNVPCLMLPCSYTTLRFHATS